MTPLEAMRRMQEIGPDSEGTARCVFCYRRLCGCSSHPTATEHAPDCPWLALPQILAVLEDAERVGAEDST